MALPMPPPPPVTSATWPVSSLRGHQVLRAVAFGAHLTLGLVAAEALDGAEARAHFAQTCAGRVGSDALVGNGLEELAHPQPPV